MFLHVCCSGKSHREFEIRGVRYRTSDAELLLSEFKYDLCGFVQVWDTAPGALLSIGMATKDALKREPTDTYWLWDKRLSEPEIADKFNEFFGQLTEPERRAVAKYAVRLRAYVIEQQTLQGQKP